MTDITSKNTEPKIDQKYRTFYIYYVYCTTVVATVVLLYSER